METGTQDCQTATETATCGTLRQSHQHLKLFPKAILSLRKDVIKRICIFPSAQILLRTELNCETRFLFSFLFFFVGLYFCLSVCLSIYLSLSLSLLSSGTKTLPVSEGVLHYGYKQSGNQNNITKQLIQKQISIIHLMFHCLTVVSVLFCSSK